MVYVKSSSAYHSSHKDEDRCFIREDEDWAVYAVLDGHGGKQAVNKIHYSISLMYLEVLRQCDSSTLTESPEDFRDELAVMLEREYAFLDRHLEDHTQDFSGACITSVLLSVRHPICFVSHLGDCRAVLLQNGEVTAITADHQLSNPAEQLRVARTGAKTQYGRVCGLEPTRTLGDHDVKRGAPNAVSCVPELHMVHLASSKPPGKGKKGKESKDPLVLVLATDGVWCALSDSKAMSTAAMHLSKKPMPNVKGAASAVTKLAVTKGSTDDVTTIVIYMEV